jgi:hypothetical protein
MQLGRDNNERIEPCVRIYNSLKYFVGENRIYPPGDILCVSTKNNDRYDLFIQADGKSNFNTLYSQHATFPAKCVDFIPDEETKTMRIVVK